MNPKPAKTYAIRVRYTRDPADGPRMPTDPLNYWLPPGNDFARMHEPMTFNTHADAAKSAKQHAAQFFAQHPREIGALNFVPSAITPKQLATQRAWKRMQL